jgi:acyl-CoA thioesterase
VTPAPAPAPGAAADPAAAPAAAVPVELGDAWAYGAGVLHGGWLLETIAGLALEHTAHPHPLAVSAHYVAAPRVGPGTVEVETVREGRSVASLRARLTQEGRSKVEVLLTAGRLPGPEVAPYLVEASPPSLPSPEECLRHTPSADMPRNGITEQLDVLMDPATAGFLHGAPGGSAEVRAWVRSASGREPDPLLLLTISDALPPVSFDLAIPGWVPTLELTVHLRAVPAAGWLRCVQRARLLHGGWLDEECEVWDSAGRLVVQARQLAGFREPAA